MSPKNQNLPQRTKWFLEPLGSFGPLNYSIAKDNMEKIKEEMKDIELDVDEGINTSKIWKMKKRMCPRAKEPPMAKKDKRGNIITTEKGIKHLYKETYIDRLKPNKMREGLEDLQQAKDKLFEERMKTASKNKTSPWNREQLVKVLSSLKKDKARDPHGLINDLFKPGVAGDNLIDGLLLLLNEVKEQQTIPDKFKFVNITSFYKGKGEKNNMDNERGVFGVSVLVWSVCIKQTGLYVSNRPVCL